MISIKHRKFIYLAIIGLVGAGMVGLAVFGRLAWAINPGDTVPGSTLNMVNYVYLKQGDNLTGKGVFLGTYAVGLSHCAWYDLVQEAGQPDKLKCYTSVGGKDYSGNVQATGFGVLYLEYPETCEMVGHCVLVPKLKIMIPVGDNYNYTWMDCHLTGADSETGHTWDNCVATETGASVVVKHVLGNFAAGPLNP